MSELSLLSGGKRKLDFDAAVGLLLAQSGFPVHARSCFISGPAAASLDPSVEATSISLPPPRGGKLVRSLTS
jgi:hypothetical protein